ncbi:hypothetical protein [Spongiivirga citrea]|uniref:Uncharacterized protein n=1 Tax=Spongiivirga citrea TaxID=1481457 RepID=A0A6M0CPS5_9FLAO|nr:hypothetical protein [Spongiivirga citrea]NER15930.1 hypothetical protein [Spongiivirga citrea]
MNNPAILFYSKVYQYFNYAGIKTFNLHAQTSFIFSVTVFFYVYKMVEVVGLELSLPYRIALLLLQPTLHVATYMIFNQDKMTSHVMNFQKNEDSNGNAISTLLTAALVLPMLVFFTKVAFGM